MKRLKLIIHLLILTILLTVGCTNPFTEKPSMVLKKMSQTMSNVNSLSYNMDMETNMTASNDQGQTDSIHSTVNMNAQIYSKQKGSLSLSDIFQGQKMQGTFSGTTQQSGLSTNFQIQLKLVDDYMYIKIDKYPMLANLAARDPSIKDMLNKWMKTKSENSSAFNSSSFLPSSIFGNSTNKKQDLSDEQRRQIAEINNFYKFFNLKQNYGKEKINDIDTWHYAVVINKSEILNYIKEVNKITNEQELSEEQLAGIEKLLDKISNWPLDVWIDAKDYYLYKISADQTLNEQDFEDIYNYLDANIEDIETLSANDNLTMDLKVNIAFSKFNESFEVTPPAEDATMDLDAWLAENSPE